jgi:hypothetical protein
VKTWSIRGLKESGNTSEHARFTIMMKKQPVNNIRRGRISARISGQTSLNFGLFFFVNSAVMARPAPRSGASPERIAPPLIPALCIPAIPPVYAEA